VRFYWLLSSFLSVFLFSSAARAANLISWAFDTNRNQLVFSTDEGIQPRAQLLANPARLIVDLPGTTLGRPTITQVYSGAIRSLRVGQFDEETTRLVIELNPGYTINPEQVLVKGNSPRQWTVQLPAVQQVADSATLLPPSLREPALTNQPPARTAQQAGIQLQSFQVTRDGFFIRTSGGEPEIRINRSEDRRTINILLEGASLSSSFQSQNMAVNRYGVSNVHFSQESTSPPAVNISLQVAEESPDWQASFSDIGSGLVLLPQGETAAKLDRIPRTMRTSQRVVRTDSSENPQASATVQSVELNGSSDMLLIRTDQPVAPSKDWDSAANAYRIAIPSAKLGRGVREPQLAANGPLTQVRLQQLESDTVGILVKTAAGVQLGEISQVNENLIAIQLLGAKSQPPGGKPITVPPPENPQPPVKNPPVRNGRIVVMVDPGHGGKDGGAPSITGYNESTVVLAISQLLAARLEREGIQVILTRNADYFVDLAPRVEMAQQAKVDLFVSIHANSIDGRPDVNGLETYHYNRGELLARTIHNSILQSIDIRDRGVRSARFYVLRNNSMPAVLVETGFVTSPTEAPKLADPAYQQKMADAIANGVLQYIRQNLSR